VAARLHYRFSSLKELQDRPGWTQKMLGPYMTPAAAAPSAQGGGDPYAGEFWTQPAYDPGYDCTIAGLVGPRVGVRRASAAIWTRTYRAVPVLPGTAALTPGILEQRLEPTHHRNRHCGIDYANHHCQPHGELAPMQVSNRNPGPGSGRVCRPSKFEV